MNKSDTFIPPISPPSSAAGSEAYLAYVEFLNNLSKKPKTLAQIKIEGEISLKIVLLWVLCIVTGILALFGMLSFFIKPNISKDIWIIIGPIITFVLTGLIVVFLTAGKIGKK
jgi:hypothetical protein